MTAAEVRVCRCCGRAVPTPYARSNDGFIHFDCWEEHHCGPDTPWPPDHRCEVPA